MSFCRNLLEFIKYYNSEDKKSDIFRYMNNNELIEIKRDLQILEQLIKYEMESRCLKDAVNVEKIEK